MARTTTRSDYPSYDAKWGEPRRSIRISDQLWTDASYAAAQNGESVSVVLRRALEQYIAANPVEDGDDEG